MNILDAIVEHKRVEILRRKQKRPLSNLVAMPGYRRRTNGILLPVEGCAGIIAEFKRKSPSRGMINRDADPLEVAGGYAAAGAAAVSILTDRDFFGGSLRDLRGVREQFPELPLLRKDFIIDPYQLHEASAYGADLVLLIAAILEKGEVADLALEARSLDMQVLFEVHGEEELEKYDPAIGYVGVNNRDLKTFRVDTATSIRLAGRLPREAVWVSESGISTREDLETLSEAGFRLFLMGERFMREPDPGAACRKFMTT